MTRGTWLGAFAAAFALAATSVAGAIPTAAATGTVAGRPGDPPASSIGRTPDRDVVLGLIVIKDSLAVTNRSLKATMTRAGAEVSDARSITPTLGVVNFDQPVSFAQAAPIAAALEARPDIVAVGPNRKVYPSALPSLPNDPLFPQQWDMWNGGDAADYGTQAARLWTRTTGSSKVVVGIIDTGSTTHPDLLGTTVPGFDFIEDASAARDGNAWDSNPADEGDWCPSDGTQSDWHGTHVQGTINAIQNNGIGVSGLAPAVKVQHLRVIGACGGAGADILAAIIWGSGGRLGDYFDAIPGQNPGMNPTPASVLNMSLGGDGPCDAVSQQILDEARARGTTVVVAAGNESHAVSNSWPGNCQRVVTVASGTRAGNLSGFSNYGTAPGQIAITAPGSTITSTVNQGSTIPTLPGYGDMSGTSMATPHVAAAAAILYSLGVTSPDAVLQRLQAAVRPFPATSSCDPVRCGAGILDASLLTGPEPVTVPSAPTGASARALSTTSALVEWVEPSTSGGAPITSYAILASQDGGAFEPLLSTDTSATSSDVVGLVPGATYAFKVAAVNSAGTGEYSSATDPVVMPTKQVTKPGQVQDFTRGKFARSSDTYRVTVRWKAPLDDGGSAVTGYVARLGVNGRWSGWSSLNNPATLLTRLGAGKRYTLAVRAVNAKGRGAAATYAFTTPRR